MIVRKKKNKKDIKYILSHLREEDKLECVAVHGQNYKKAVFDSIMNTDYDIIIGYDKKNKKPVCMGGIAHISSDAEGVGIVMMLSTEDIRNHQYSLLTGLKKLFAEYDEKYWLTYNFIYSKNYMAKRWLKWLGFRFDLNNNLFMSEEFEYFYRIKEFKGLL